MTVFEEILMRKVIEKSARYPNSVVDSFEEFKQIWAGKDFSPMFNTIIGELPAVKTSIARMRFGTGLTLVQVGEQAGVSSERVRQVCNEVIQHMRRNLKYLVMDMTEYEDMLKQQQAEQEALRKQREKDPLIFDIGLTTSAVDRIMRYIVENNLHGDNELTVSYVAKILPRLNLLNTVAVSHCGQKTKANIIQVFKEHGVDVSAWEKEYQETYIPKKKRANMDLDR